MGAIDSDQRVANARFDYLCWFVASPAREDRGYMTEIFPGAAAKRLSAGLLVAVFMLTPVMAQNVPFATPPSSRNPSESAVGTLANIMLNMQLRHIKLWFAGKAKNWELAKYEAEKLKADFDVAAGFYRGLPVENIVTAANPLNRLIEAAAKKDSALYSKAFNEMTDGCNSCHAAGQVGFVRIRTPKTLPFDDQIFER